MPWVERGRAATDTACVTAFPVMARILQEKGDQGFSNPDETIYIPLATAQFRVFGTDRVGSIYVQAVNATSMDAAVAEIDRVVRRELRQKPGEASQFNVRNQTTLLETFQETAKTFTFLLAGIAFVSLVVGGIGIMNIMLVSVTERTREIGLRMAIGARGKDVLMQFLVEAIVLSLFGGMIGIGFGYGLAEAAERFLQWPTTIPANAIGMAFGFAAATGVFFGFYPARKAARLDPIEALRFE